MTDLLNKTLEELIEFCKEKEINYLTKAKKPMSKKTIINNLKKMGFIDSNDEDDDLDTETTDIDVIIRKTHNYLYKSSGIVGSKAQNDIMRVLIMKIFNILLSKNNTYLLSVLDDANINEKCSLKSVKIDKYKSYIFDISNLLKELDIKNAWSNFIKDFISKLFNNIYIPEDANFNTPNDYDIIRLIKIISKFNITDEFINDFFMKNGDIHESFLKYQGKVNSKELGQFFTPRIVVKSLLNECGFKDLILNHEGSNLSLCDLCMGTGGLLCYTYNYCKDKIDPSKIYGCDIEKDTIKFGSASLMLATNQYNSNIIRCNSLIENPYLFNKEEDKFDIIFINPPFGTKNNYKSLNKLFDNYKNKIASTSNIEFNDIYPINSNTGTILFIQLIIYSLKKNGIACIILPDGEIMTSVNNMTIRKYILDNCQILKIVNIQGGLFTNTGIKTKALIIKKCNNDNYNQDIEFIDLNKEIKSLGFKKLNDKLQFNFEDKKEETNNYNDNIEIKSLIEICEFLPKSIKQASFGDNIGLYNFYSSSSKIKKCNINDYIDECIIIGTGGKANIHIDNNFSCSADNYIIKSIEQLNKYIYYYLKLNIYLLEDGFNGAVIKHLSKEYLKLIKIPIPSLEIQTQIVEYLDMIYEKIIKINNDKIEDIKKLNKYYIDFNIGFNKDIEIKILGEIADMSIKGNTNTKQISNTGEYPFYKASVKNPNGTHNIYCFNDNEYILFIKSGGNGSNPLSLSHGIGKVYYVNGKSCGNTEVNKISIINNNIKLKYLYYYLLFNQLNIQKLAVYTTNLGHINMTEFKLMKIPIPSIEKQKEIIEYLDFNDELIKTLEKENEINKNNADLLMKQILYK
jgi:type I restriction enzyme S subunit